MRKEEGTETKEDLRDKIRQHIAKMRETNIDGDEEDIDLNEISDLNTRSNNQYLLNIANKENSSNMDSNNLVDINSTSQGDISDIRNIPNGNKYHINSMGYSE